MGWVVPRWNAMFELDSGRAEPGDTVPRLLCCLSSRYPSRPLCLWDLACGHKPATGLGRSGIPLAVTHSQQQLLIWDSRQAPISWEASNDLVPSKDISSRTPRTLYLRSRVSL